VWTSCVWHKASFLRILVPSRRGGPLTSYSPLKDPSSWCHHIANMCMFGGSSQATASTIPGMPSSRYLWKETGSAHHMCTSICKIKPPHLQAAALLLEPSL
jgi:hypothetical protein